jgi:hypothetical protein
MDRRAPADAHRLEPARLDLQEFDGRMDVDWCAATAALLGRSGMRCGRWGGTGANSPHLPWRDDAAVPDHESKRHCRRADRPRTLTAQTAMTLHSQLELLLQRPAGVLVVDLHNVEQCDVTAVTVLRAAAAVAAASGGAMRWRARPARCVPCCVPPRSCATSTPTARLRPRSPPIRSTCSTRHTPHHRVPRTGYPDELRFGGPAGRCPPNAPCSVPHPCTPELPYSAADTSAVRPARPYGGAADTIRNSAPIPRRDGESIDLSSAIEAGVFPRSPGVDEAACSRSAHRPYLVIVPMQHVLGNGDTSAGLGCFPPWQPSPPHRWGCVGATHGGCGIAQHALLRPAARRSGAREATSPHEMVKGSATAIRRSRRRRALPTDRPLGYRRCPTRAPNVFRMCSDVRQLISTNPNGFITMAGYRIRRWCA